MDPDETLKILREALAKFDTAPARSLEEHDAAHDVASAAEALDDWISKGGFLPLAWQNFGGMKRLPDPPKVELPVMLCDHGCVLCARCGLIPDSWKPTT